MPTITAKRPCYQFQDEGSNGLGLQGDFSSNFELLVKIERLFRTVKSCAHCTQWRKSDLSSSEMLHRLQKLSTQKGRAHFTFYYLLVKSGKKQVLHLLRSSVQRSHQNSNTIETS